jgi:hypothetical protein
MMAALGPGEEPMTAPSDEETAEIGWESVIDERWRAQHGRCARCDTPFVAGVCAGADGDGALVHPDCRGRYEREQEADANA